MSYIGTNKLGTMYLGDTKIGKAYLGSDLVYEVGSSALEPYIETGLILWLDGADYTSGSWVDRIGNRSFTMYNTSASGGGVVFNGSSSYGSYGTLINAPYNASTIEVVADVANTSTYMFLFSQPSSSYVSMLMHNKKLGNASNAQINLRNIRASSGKHTFSLSHNYAYEDKVAATSGGSDWFGSRTGNVLIGQRGQSQSFFKGTIYQIRIYNRILTSDEVLYNQGIDIRKYNITT